MKISKVLVGVLIFCAACNHSTDKKTPGGLEFKIVKSGDGVTAKSGQLVIFNFSIKDGKDSVWVDTYKRGLPEVLTIADTAAAKTEDVLLQMLRMLSTGDSAKFSITAKKLFVDLMKYPMPPRIDSSLQLNYTLSVRKILDRENFESFRDQVLKEFEAKQAAHAKAQLGHDTVLIDEYLAKKNIVAKKLPSGLRYIITTPGTGPLAASGQSVNVNYAGYLLDGAYFDTNIKSVAKEKGLYDSAREAMQPYGPFNVVIDQTQVIKGWHDALKQLNKGAKGTFYIPSTLAYGEQARGPVIKENSILVFDIELVDIVEPLKIPEPQPTSSLKPTPSSKKPTGKGRSK